MTETKESKFYYVVLFFILILGFFLRAYLMDLRPLHADEGVNFMFMNDIIKRGHYQYNPENYHGPTLYYLTLLPFYYFCLDTSPMPEEVLPTPETVYRLCPMLLGFGVVLILIPLKKWLGKAGLLTAMAFAAISPTAVYYSRDNIHEMYLMFFTAAAFVMGYLYFTTQKNKFMYLTAAFIALMFATKETTMVTVVVWCLSAIGASIFTTDPIFDLAKRFKESIKGAFGIYKKPVFICFFLITILTLCLMLFASNNFKKVELKWYIALLTKGIAMVTL
ncbi:glycosyltransferase family 39 protein, partial [bacterium]|nr:glycosyltransferase family 39 protein [bacterium]